MASTKLPSALISCVTDASTASGIVQGRCRDIGACCEDIALVLHTSINICFGERESDRERETERERETDRQTDRERERERERQTDRQRERERETETETVRETNENVSYYFQVGDAAIVMAVVLLLRRKVVVSDVDGDVSHQRR